MVSFIETFDVNDLQWWFSGHSNFHSCTSDANHQAPSKSFFRNEMRVGNELLLIAPNLSDHRIFEGADVIRRS
jgi:hypothetical protein